MSPKIAFVLFFFGCGLLALSTAWSGSPSYNWGSRMTQTSGHQGGDCKCPCVDDREGGPGAGGPFGGKFAGAYGDPSSGGSTYDINPV